MPVHAFQVVYLLALLVTEALVEDIVLRATNLERVCLWLLTAKLLRRRVPRLIVMRLWVLGQLRTLAHDSLGMLPRKVKLLLGLAELRPRERVLLLVEYFSRKKVAFFAPLALP